MTTVTQYREIIEQTLRSAADTPPSTGNVEYQLVFDRDREHYLLISVGWGNQCRLYGTIAHVDIIGEEVWIQQDGTEEGLAFTLRENGICGPHRSRLPHPGGTEAYGVCGGLMPPL
ncbi:MAG: element excision factor XisI family protein [Gemmataceae bacterium]